MNHGMSKINLSEYGYSVVHIETFSVCNMNCSYCIYPLTRKTREKLPTKVVYKVIDSIDASDPGFEYVAFNQLNEPLMDNRIFDFIKYAEERSLPVNLITNGLLLGSEKIRKNLIDASPSMIKISLQTLRAKDFKRTRNINYSYKKFKEGIFKFISEFLDSNSKSKVTIDVACNFLTPSKQRAKNLLGLQRGDPSVIDSVSEIKSDFGYFVKELSTYDQRFEYDEEHLDEYFKGLERTYIRQDGLRIAENVSLKIKHFFYGRKMIDFYPVMLTANCDIRLFTILANGNVTPCCFIYDNSIVLGNVKSASLREILADSEILENLRLKNKLPIVCKRCQGAPSLRGALTMSLYNFYKSRRT